MIIKIVFFVLFSTAVTLFARKPNVVFLLVDDLGWKDMGCYGSNYYETPSIDQLAKEGTRFTAAYSAHPVCGPSRAALLTGKFPISTGNTGVVGNLPLEEKNMAEVFEENGYTTYFTGKWHLGMTEGRNPGNQGFDYVVGVNHAGQPGSYFYPYKDIGQDWIGGKRRIIPERDVLGLEDGEPGEYLTDRLTDEALGFIDTHRDEPFFLYFSYYAVHTPLQGKEEYIKKYEPKGNELFTRDVLRHVDGRAWSRIRQSNPVYAANVQSLDDSIGRIMQKLKELGLDKNTIIVFTSDNGGVSTTRGGMTQTPTSNLPLRFGKGWLYEGGIRVPGIIKFPEKVKAGQTSDRVICGYDFYPTILSLAGLPLLPEQHAAGLDIFDPGMERAFRERSMYWYYPLKHGSGHDPSAAIRKGDHKLILDLESGISRLYNIREDLAEESDIAEEKEQLAGILKMDLQAFLEANKPE